MSAAPREPRRSPLEDWYERVAAGRRLVEDMSLPSALKDAVPRGTAVRLGDLSWRRRLGCKGPGAPEWLAAQGFVVPAAANSWQRTDSVIVARLATSEFLVEASGGAGPAAKVEGARQLLATASCPSGVYPVARHDLVVSLAGPSTVDLLRQTCSVDFAPLLAAAGADKGPVLFTSMIGVGVLALPASAAAGPGLTLWVDPSFAHYLWGTLLEVAVDLGGGVDFDAPTGG
jgi:sarcosine oxidase subunit gamma